jgi:hypothetical protein
LPPKRTGLKVIGAVLTILLLGVVGYVVRTGAGNLLGNASAGQPNPSGPSASSPSTGSQPADPFAGTPAAQYAQGEDGIALPATTAVPGFTVAQVETALQQVRAALVAARLDPAMLVSHDPAGLLKLLSPHANTEIKPYFDSQKFFGFATQVAPGYTLTSDKIRVSGKVTFQGTTANGVRLLDVVTNFVWVYPFTGPVHEPGDHLVVVHDQVTWDIPVDTDVDKDYQGLRISTWNGFASNMDCSMLKQSLLALGHPQLVTATPSTGAEDKNAAFDPSRSLQVNATC